MSRTMNIPIFIPHNGCPNDCVFCNQRKISGVKESVALDEARLFIEASIQTANHREDIEIAFFGGSFTGLDRDIQKAYLELGTSFVHKHNLKGIRMSTRPDYITKEIIEFLRDYPVTAIELGVQSLNEDVLLASKRNHTIEHVENAVKLIKGANIELGLQMMIGLPKDREEYVQETLELMISFKPKTVRIYPTLVIKDTELEHLYNMGHYKPLKLEEAIEQVAKILAVFIEHNITVLRVGLQANDGLNSGDYIAGPYHPAFKELVMDAMVYNSVLSKFMTMLESEDIGRVKESDRKDKRNNNEEEMTHCYKEPRARVFANRKLYNRLVGHKKKNKIAFEDIGLHIQCDESMENDLICIRSKQSSTIFPLRL